MIFLVTILLIFFLTVDFLVLALIIFNYKKYEPTEQGMAKVSILLAAKDEETTISRCLDSLVELSYSKEHLEILIGNDQSSDDTLSIARRYEEKHDHIKVVDITSKLGEQKGKANVLAQLAQQANGEYYLITDADMSLPVGWVQYMLSPIEGKVGMAIGVTQVVDNRMQDMDWLYALGMIKVVTDLDFPVTGMGNNMIISKEAYQSVGGYENIPFSITEDYELYKQVKQKGYQCTHVFQKETLGSTLPIKGWSNLLNQRKRWMKGTAQLPLPTLLLLSLQSVFYVGLIVVFFSIPNVAFVLLIVKLLLRGSLMASIRARLNISFRFLSAIFFEAYSFFLTITSSTYFILPTKIIWKGREY